MSSGTWQTTNDQATSVATALPSPYAILKALGSLKITVSLFALGIFMVLVGTLAQDDETMVQVKRDYFNAWVSWIPFDVFIPSTVWEHQPIRGGFPFPGGALIGFGLLVNLIAAKATRFAIQAKGLRLAIGLIVSLLGTALVIAVIMAGHTADGLQGQPPVSYDQLWAGLRTGFVILSLAAAVYAFGLSKLPGLAKWSVRVGVALMGALSISLLLGGHSLRLDDPGLRIVWQLLQATLASCVMLVGFHLLFGKRGANMLIHIGVGLLMVGQFMFGDRQVEQRITLIEGEQSSMAYMQDEVEIALIDVGSEDVDHVKAIPEALIRRAVAHGQVIDDKELPCIVRIDKWMTNSALKRIQEKENGENPATIGAGLTFVAVETQPAGGAQSDMNHASAYVTLIDRQSNEPLGTLLLSQWTNDAGQVLQGGVDRNEQIEIDGKQYQIALRFRRDYKDYTVYLKDVVRENYSGSNTPRDYSSLIRIRNEKTGEEITEKTWMNNPIRFAGETFYQSNYFPMEVGDGKIVEGSGLQVVRNAGWVIPYVCCMMVLVGMVVHFGHTFLRFANRVARDDVRLQLGQWTTKSWVALAVGVVIAAMVGGYGLKGQKYGVNEVDWIAVGKLPVQHEGRIKPADTVASNILAVLSEPVFGGSAYVIDADGSKRPRVEWLLATMADLEWTYNVPVFRVYAKEVRDLLGLEERKNYRYTYNEINENRKAFFDQIGALREKSDRREELNFREQKIAEFYSKLTTFELLATAYSKPDLSRIGPTDTDEGMQRAMLVLDNMAQQYRVIQSMNPPAFIPPRDEAHEAAQANSSDEALWVAFGPATFNSMLDNVRGMQVNPAIDAFGKVLEAVRSSDSREINKAVQKHQRQVRAMEAAEPYLSRVSAEQWLNNVNPTMLGIALYLLALAVGMASFVFYKSEVRNVAFGILLGVFVIHTVSLIIRMYVSQQPPITNLYSTAIFIGWAGVLLCLILEMVYRFGIANIAASTMGIVTLCIARSLDKGDTLHVLQAVLDTQFWLSTHVVTINLGYAATFAAGLFGIGALVFLMVAERMQTSPSVKRVSLVAQSVLYRIVYFFVCLGILFSFVGTVLGGLWADDSWGRFWGWDPKENGALMLVMWNAIALHARWDKMVGLRGFSILALVGNIITAWSWFGTNLLQFGLHTYGFNSGLAITFLSLVAIHSLMIIVALTLTSSKKPSVSDSL